MTQENLLSRLNFQKQDVYLDGRVIFSAPQITTAGDIQVLGVPQNGQRIYAGTGSCCYGYMAVLERIKEDEDDFRLEALVPTTFNVFDIIPVSVDYVKTGFGNNDAVLVTGYGCAGAGVKLIGVSHPNMIEVIPRNEFKEIEGTTKFTAPRLNVRQQDGAISLDFFRVGDRLKPGRTRTPNLPEILIDQNYESYVSQDVIASKDLTQILRDSGVNIKETVERNKDYTRMRR